MSDRTVACNLCESSSYKLVYDTRPLRYVSCECCGLVFANPQIPSDELSALYRGEQYFVRKDVSGLGADYIARGAQDVATGHGRLALLDRYCGGRRGKLLEIGCAVGHYLLAARERGWDPLGIEVSDYAARYGREQYGLDIIEGTLETADVTPASIDAVLMFHVLEHLPDPYAALQRVGQLMRDGAVLLIEVPDIASRRARREGETWPYLAPREHLYQFSKETLAAILQKAGFEILTLQTTSRPALLKPMAAVGGGLLIDLVKRNIRHLQWGKHLLLKCRSMLGLDDLLIAIARKRPASPVKGAR